MITFDSSYERLGTDVSGTFDEVPINGNLRLVQIDKIGVVVMDVFGNWGHIHCRNTADFDTNVQLFNYLYPFTQIGRSITKKIEVCSSELKVCSSSPIELVSAPGIGLIVLPQTLGYKSKYKSIVYDFAQNLFVHSDSKTSADAFFALNKGIVNAAADRSGVLSNIIPAGVSTANSYTENEALVLKALTSDATQGDGYLTLYLQYTIVEEAWRDGVYCS